MTENGSIGMMGSSTYIRNNSSAQISQGRDRLKSNASLLTSVELDHLRYEKITTAHKNKWLQMAKMVSVILIPIITLIVLCVIALVSAISLQHDTNRAQSAVNDFLLIDELVTKLQVERGTTATFLSSGGEDHLAFSRLQEYRNETNKAVAQLEISADTHIVDSAAFATHAELIAFLDVHRDEVDEIAVPVDISVEFYTNLTTGFIDLGDRNLILPERGDMWSTVVATSSMLRASDAVGIQRALGSTYFVLCGFSTSSQTTYFSRLNGQTQILLNMVFSFDVPSKIAYQERYTGSVLDHTISQMRRDIWSDDYLQECLNYTSEVRFENALFWFDNITAYLEILKNIRSEMVNSVLERLDGIIGDVSSELTVYSVLMIVVTIICVSISMWYAARLLGLISRIAVFAQKISAQTKDLAAEMKKADFLLFQMMPRSVAEKMKLGEEINVEYFLRATVFFSDIVGFTSMSSVCTPMQVVELLNSLYSMFDALIEKRDAYKVETIGDAYMVVSGVPQPNSDHAAEISHLSLDLLEAIHSFVPPHDKNKKLKIRIGIHSGPCAAGVVGVKMPRYCLFGNTVMTASHMESSSEAQRIQISELTKKELDDIGGFLMTYRGHMELKTKKKIKTYFLDGRKEVFSRPSAIKFSRRSKAP